jgi:alpha-glucoside transport system permease protein
MQAIEEGGDKSVGVGTRIVAFVARVLLAIIIPLAAFAVLYAGFIFLRDSDAPKWVIALVAIVWGVGGVAMLYWIVNWLVEQLPRTWTHRLQPYVFVGPAVAILIWYLTLPTFRTFWLSLLNQNSTDFVGFSNYIAIFTDRLMRESFRNNLMWLIFGTILCVGFGLLVAVLADRSRAERLWKAIVFMPMAISFVGAGVIWNFIYEYRPAEAPQIGLLNAIVVGLGGQPQAWPAWVQISPWNNLFLIVIVGWLQTGFAMVLFSAAIKSLPGEVLEAARVDGASEIRIFFGIIVPMIMSTIITVTTTIIIFTLKIFDVVWVMTGGQFGTDVIGTQFYRQYFIARNFGFGSAIAIILLICVIPVMIYNLRQLRRTEAF